MIQAGIGQSRETKRNQSAMAVRHDIHLLRVSIPSEILFFKCAKNASKKWTQIKPGSHLILLDCSRLHNAREQRIAVVLIHRTTLLLASLKYADASDRCEWFLMASQAIGHILSIVVVIAFVLAILGGYSVVHANFQQGATQSTSRDHTYASDINSSSPCTYSPVGNSSVPSQSITSESASSIISSIESYPEFVSLEGNRTYAFEEFGCSGGRNPTNGTMAYQSFVTFSYYEWAHPIYYQCGNQTASTPPDYEIVVTLALTPKGYNLANSTFTSSLFPPFETCSNSNFSPT